jgi:hypothetical protein
VAVAEYRVERCQGVGCNNNFVQVARPVGTTLIDTGLAAASTYGYRVRAVDTAGNLGPYSAIASGTTWTSAPTGLVAAYAFDEGGGTTVADYSGQGNTGAVSGATWTAQGRFGTALFFDGTGAQVTIADSASLRLTSGMTLEAWVYPTATASAWRAIVDKNVDGYYLMASSSNAPNNWPAVGGTWNAGNQNTLGPTALPVNAWTHLAGTWDGATVRLYVNGVQVASRPQTTPLTPTPGTLQIGGDSYGEFFTGIIDEVRIYGRALSEAELQADMATGVAALAVDTAAPTIPTGLSAAIVGSGRVDLSWTASSDNTGVAAYGIERCQGQGCTDFAQIATSAVPAFSDTSVVSADSYTYRVRASDAAGNRSDYSNTASVNLQLATMSVTTAGQGSGTITSTPAGIACGGTCSGTFPAGTIVTLTATAAAGSVFAGWSGGCSGTGPCTVTLTAATAVTGSFAPAPPVSFVDDFQRPNSTTLGDGWSSVSGTFVIENGKLRNGTLKTRHIAVEPSLVMAVGRLAADFTSLDNNAAPALGLVFGYTDPMNYYAAYRKVGGAAALKVVRVVDGVETVLGRRSCPNPTRGQSFRMTLTFTPDTATLTWGTLSVTAKVSIASGAVGVMVDSGGIAHTIDNFAASE